MRIAEYDIIITTVFITALILLLSIFGITLLLLFQKRRQQHDREMLNLKYSFEQQLLQSQIEVQEATFSTLAKELHDNIGQLLSSTKILISITQRNMSIVPDTLITAEETLGKAINELRSLSKSLTKEWLARFNLVENLQTEVIRINSTNEVQIFLSSPQNLSIEADQQIILFRIIQESLQNALKHARPKNISINIFEGSKDIRAEIKDDGIGFDITDSVKGIGIINMKHRAELLHGSIQWKSDVGSGTVVEIVLPINHPTL